MRQDERGRSMVEMLGVLAIVGILTVCGVAGLRYIMSVHYANSILDGLDERGFVAVEQESKGNIHEESWLNEFDPQIMHLFPVDLSIVSEKALGLDEAIVIRASAIPYRVCNQLKGREYREGIMALVNNLPTEVAVCNDNDDNTFAYAMQTGGYTPCKADDDCPACTSCSPDKICRPIDCGGGYTCDPTIGPRGKCRSYCTSSKDCTGEQVCNSEHQCEVCKYPKVPNASKTACECPIRCLGDGYSGQNYDDCSCICKRNNVDAKGNPIPCACPTGTLLMKDDSGNDVCQFSGYCTVQASNQGEYTCYLPGSQNLCGNFCSDTSMAPGICNGACQKNFCSENVPGSTMAFSKNKYGNGCKKGDSFCTPLTTSYQWQCLTTIGSSANQDCCRTTSTGSWGQNFGIDKCYYGTCKKSVCDALSASSTSVNYKTFGQYVAGCEITKNGHTAYCFPRGLETTDADWDWWCGWNIPNSINPPAAEKCATCKYSDLKTATGGNCSACFQTASVTCPAAGKSIGKDKNGNDVVTTVAGTSVTYQDKPYCKYTFGGREVWCSTKQGCYFLDSENAPTDKCCYSTALSPDYCRGGRCSSAMPGYLKTRNLADNISGDCPAGSSFEKGSTYYGCVTERNGDKFFFMDGSISSDYACFFKNSKDQWQICGLMCKSDCSLCQTVEHKKCQLPRPENCTDGHLENCPFCTIETAVVKSGGVRQCRCSNGYHETNNHCCATGNEYLNGKCQQSTCSSDQCLNVSDCIEVSDNVGRIEGGGSLCHCLKPNYCWDRWKKECISAPLPEKNYVDANAYFTVDSDGRCEYACEDENYTYDTSSGSCKKNS